MSQGEHAPLAPSSAPQWGHCSGSVLAQADAANLETPQSREGTAAHWVVAEVLESAKAGRPTHAAAYLGTAAPNGVIIDEKMAEGAQIMCDDVLGVCERFNCLDRLLIECRVAMPHIHAQNWGTLDAAVHLPEHRKLFIWDYKHGYRDCQPKDNLQLVNYLAGLVNIDDLATDFVARIVQPFSYDAAGPVKEWAGRMSDLRGWWNILANKAEEAFTAPKLTTGAHCRDCRAIGKCAATRKARYNFIELVNEPYEMDDMEGADLRVEREILQQGVAVAKARLDAIEDELKHRITQGDATTGLTVQSKAGRLEWNCGPAQARGLCAQFGVDITKDTVLTPTQTKSAAPKEVRPLLEQVMADYTRRPAGSLKLVDAENSLGARAFRNQEQ